MINKSVLLKYHVYIDEELFTSYPGELQKNQV